MTASRHVDAVLFDAAGTLIRPREPVGATYARVARAHGVDLPATRLDDAFRRMLRAAPPMAFPHAPAAGIPRLERAWWHTLVRGVLRAADATARFSDFDAFFDELWSTFAAPTTWEVLPGAPEALARLRAEGRRLAVASNFDLRLHVLLEGLGLAAGLDAVLLPAELRLAKPDPAFFAAACARLGVAPARAVFVGDDPEHDIAAAERAGLRAIDVGSLATLEDVPARVAALEPPEEPSA